MVFRQSFKGVHFGTIRLDIRTKCVGRIQKSTGIGVNIPNSTRLFNQIKEMIKELDVSRDYDKLLLIKTGKVKLLDCLKDFQLGRQSFISSYSNHPLLDEFNKYIKVSGLSEKTKSSYKQSVKHLANISLITPDTKVRDIPDILRITRNRYEQERKSVSFNRVRGYLLSFLRKHCSYEETNPILVNTKNIKSLPLKHIREHHPITSYHQLVSLLNIINSKYGKNKNIDTRLPYDEWILFWCFTGLRPDEFYNGKWTRDKKTGHIRILGTKTSNANRVVPNVFWLSPEKRNQYGLTERLTKLDVPYRPRDFRRTYSVFLELINIPQSRIRYYMGHGNVGVTQLYQTNIPTEQILNEDMNSIKEWIGIQRNIQITNEKRAWSQTPKSFLQK